MSNLEDDVSLIDEITEVRSLPSAAARIATLEALLQRAEADELYNSAIFARVALAADAVMSNADDLAPALGLLAESQQRARERPDDLISPTISLLLILTQAILHLLLHHPEIPLDRVELLRRNYEDFCKQHGMTLRGACALAMTIAARRGDHAAAQRLFMQSQAQPRSDYLAADTVSDAIGWYAGRGLDAEALQLYGQADPNTERHYYSYVLTNSLIPAQRSGRTELAARLYEESLDHHDDLDSGHGSMLSYLAIAGRYDDGLALIPLLTRPAGDDTDWSRAEIAEHLVVLLSHLQAAGRGDEPVSKMDATVDELLERYRSVAERTARQIDQVNKMDVVLRRLHAFWAEHCPAAHFRAQVESRSAPPTAPPTPRSSTSRTK